jgi:hypothetical protein
MQFGYAGVQFTNDDNGNSKAYTYKYPLDLTLNIGDIVVVPVGAKFRPTLGTVLGVKTEIVENPKIKYKYIIDKVDFTLYNTIQQ